MIFQRDGLSHNRVGCLMANPNINGRLPRRSDFKTPHFLLCIVHIKNEKCSSVPFHSSIFQVDAPVGWDPERRYHGFTLPSTRDTSVSLVAAHSIRLDQGLTAMVMSFGQFLSHDTDLTRHLAQVPGMDSFPNKVCLGL
jgi:hypothetical protein